MDRKYIFNYDYSWNHDSFFNNDCSKVLSFQPGYHDDYEGHYACFQESIRTAPVDC